MLWNCVVRCSLCVIYFYQFYIVRRYLEIGSVAMLTVRRNEFQFHIYLSPRSFGARANRNAAAAARTATLIISSSHIHNLVSIFPTKPRARAHQMKKSFIFSTRAALFFCSSDFESARRFSREQRSRWKLCSNDQSTYRPRPTDSQKKLKQAEVKSKEER